MSTAGRVIVVGGGVIGAACAHYLCQSGWAVTVLDQGRFGMGCSGDTFNVAASFVVAQANCRPQMLDNRLVNQFLFKVADGCCQVRCNRGRDSLELNKLVRGETILFADFFTAFTRK